MHRETKSVLITDVDNTLFNWVEIWYQPFRAMLDVLVHESGLSEEVLIPEIKKIHQKYGTSEYAFLIKEIPSLRKNDTDMDLASKYQNAIDAYREARRSVIKLYPTVWETLLNLKSKGCLLVAYTESMKYYTNYRIRKLNLDEIIDYIYSPPDHELPSDPKEIRKYPEEHYEYKLTLHRELPPNELKPNPKVLLDIIDGIGATPSECIYVGDSLMKDVAMAQDARVTDVYVKYGAAQHTEAYDLLKKVTHWTDEQVEKEKEINEGRTVIPSYSIDSYADLLNLFNFVQFSESLPRKVYG